MNIEFQNHKESLFEIILGENHHIKLLNLINQLYENGKTKKEIYDLFLNFHAEIQIDKRTRELETIYDKLSDFMDGFTDYGKGSKILPNKSNF